MIPTPMTPSEKIFFYKTKMYRSPANASDAEHFVDGYTIGKGEVIKALKEMKQKISDEMFNMDTKGFETPEAIFEYKYGLAFTADLIDNYLRENYGEVPANEINFEYE